MSKGKFARKFVPERYKKNGMVVSSGAILRISIERLGPTFVKFGQILVERPDILPDYLREEFRKLHSNVTPVDDEIAFRLIEKEIRGEIEDYFSYISPTSIASASIGQVYKAKLKNGQMVVIKIQRPFIEDKIKRDILILKWFFNHLKHDIPELQTTDITALLDEFGKGLLKELNYLNEASNIVRFKEMLQGFEFCVVPKVYDELCTKKMLVMEYLEGETISHKDELIQNGFSPKTIAHNLLQIYLEMIVAHGFFHADPHKGNIILLTNNRIGLIDFGLTGKVKPNQIQNILEVLIGIKQINARQITDSLVELCGLPSYSNTDDVEFEISNILKQYHAASDKMPLSMIVKECTELLVENKMKLPANIVLLLKALATVESTIKELNPEIELVDYIKPYTKAIIKNQFSVNHIAQVGLRSIKKYIHVLRQLPDDVSEILSNVKQGKLIHDIKFSNDNKFNSTIKSIGKIVASSIITGFALIGGAILLSFNEVELLSKILLIAATVNTLWLLYKIKTLIND